MGTGRLMRQKIMLPINDKTGEPDYEFMDEYMRQIEQKLLEKYKTYISKEKDNNDKYGGVKSKDGNLTL